MARKPYALRARFAQAEIIGGKLVLRGTWERHSRREVEVSIHPEDVSIVQKAMAEFGRGNKAYFEARETRKAKALHEKEVRRTKREEAKRRREADMHNGVKLVGD